MSRTTWQALRTELLRSTAPAAVLATLVLGALLMYSESSSWAGRWMPFAAAVRFSTLVLAPIAVALGTWQGGRERRRRIGEQLASTPRPRWQPLIVAWAGVTLGCWLGLLVVVAAGAALVAPVATYAGGGWWWLLAVTPVALAAMTAVGIALGRAARFWVAAPIAMIVMYALQVYAHDAWGLRGAEWLAPIVAVHNAWGQTVSGRVHLQQALWFGGLAAAVLVLAAARRRWLAILPAVVAAAGAASLLGGPPGHGWEPDLAATELVCTEDEPQVCLSQAEAFLLDDLTPVARDALARFEGVPGGPTRAVGSTYGPPPGGEPFLGLDTSPVTITGELYREEWSAVQWQPELVCESPDTFERYRWMAELAAIWGSGNEPVTGWAPEIVDGRAALLARPLAQQKVWIGDLIAAAGACDPAALDQLAERLA